MLVPQQQESSLLRNYTNVVSAIQDYASVKSQDKIIDPDNRDSFCLGFHIWCVLKIH